MTPPPGSPGVGRRLGVDVGGTKCLGVVIDDTDSVIAEVRRVTPRGPGSTTAVLDVVEEIARAAIDAVGAIDSVGVGVPGLVTRAGVLRAAPNLDGIADLDVANGLSDRLNHHVTVDNDATCALIAEWSIGSGCGVDDLLLVTLGTGIGGGVVLGGDVRRGANGFAGEFGHMTVDPDGIACPCGRRGCWERYASGSGLGLLAEHGGFAGGEELLAAARRGVSEAVEIVDRFSSWVAVGLAGLVNAIDPAVIVIGGGLVRDADVFVAGIEKHLASSLYSAHQRSVPEIRVATLGERAGAIGAAMLGAALGR